jgi:F-type H+-transporting ATPase subunit b
MEILEQLGIEPGMIVVNIAGFLLLVWVLRKFAFGPLTEIVAEREDEIDGDLAEAESQREAATRDAAAMDAELAQVAERSRELMAEARERADATRDEMVARAREQADRIVSEGKRSVDVSAEDARAALREETVQIAMDISERALRSSLDEERQVALVDAFIADVQRRATEEGEGA